MKVTCPTRRWRTCLLVPEPLAPGTIASAPPLARLGLLQGVWRCCQGLLSLIGLPGLPLKPPPHHCVEHAIPTNGEETRPLPSHCSSQFPLCTQPRVSVRLYGVESAYVSKRGQTRLDGCENKRMKSFDSFSRAEQSVPCVKLSIFLYATPVETTNSSQLAPNQISRQGTKDHANPIKPRIWG